MILQLRYCIHEKKEFFLSFNAVLKVWLAERKQKGLPPLKEIDHFCIVDDKLFNEYVSFANVFTGNHTELLLPACPLLIHFLKKNLLPVQVVKIFDEDFLDFLPGSVDDACDWISETRSHFHSVGFKAL